MTASAASGSTPAEPFKAKPEKQMWNLDPPSRNDGSAWIVGINAHAARVKANAAAAEHEAEKPSYGDRRRLRVAIIDTGIEWRHPSLRSNIDFEAACDFDVDLDGKGRLFFDGGRIDNKFDAHGTACAGIIAAVELGGCDVVGIVPEAMIVPIKLTTNFEVAAIVAALRHGDRHADVILLPRSLPSDAAIEATLREIGRRKPIVCAAGNDGRRGLIFPASLPEVIAVGACNERGYRSSYSQCGEGLDVVAPSSDVSVLDRDGLRLSREDAARLADEEARLEEAMSPPEPPKRDGAEPVVPVPSAAPSLATVAAQKKWDIDTIGQWSIATTDNLGEYGYNYEPPGDYCRAEGESGFGGTSAASAQVAGVVALVLTANPDLREHPEEIRLLLQRSANSGCLTPGRERSFVDEFGYGLVDAAAAVELARAWEP